MSFMQNYQPVEDRIRLFWEKYPTGRIHTEIVLINEQEIVIKASIFRDQEDARPASIDFAQETRGSSNINKQSFVENCSTSAIGRGLATLGFAPKGARPSKEEMQKVKPVKAAADPIKELSLVKQAEVYALEGNLDALLEVYKEAKAKNLIHDLPHIENLGKQTKEYLKNLGQLVEKGATPQK